MKTRKLRPTTFGGTPAAAVGLLGPKFVRAVNDARKGTERARREALDRVRDLQAAVGRELSAVGLVGFLWVRPEGPVDTLFTDGLEDAVDRFVDGSGMTLAMVQRPDGGTLNPGQVDTLKALFPELEINVKQERPRCETCGGVLNGGRQDIGDMCECHTCERCDTVFQADERDWIETNMNEEGEVLCSACMEGERKGTVWERPNCGHTLNDMGDTFAPSMTVVQGMWTWENGAWSHNCKDGTLHEGKKKVGK